MEITEEEKKFILINKICSINTIEEIEHLSLKEILDTTNTKQENKNIPKYIG